MTIELIASIAAILLAGYCAVTDMLWGKIFNKAIVAGLLFATVWLTVYGLFYHFGKHTAQAAPFPCRNKVSLTIPFSSKKRTIRSSPLIILRVSVDAQAYSVM